jgi:uncharacterized protein with PQ loop repeat
VQFYTIFVIVMSILTFLFNGFAIYVETLGSIALFLEALLLSPQAYQNYRKKSTVGLSFVLIGTCLTGDIFKAFYFWAKELPAQFLVCAVFQVALDLYICFQIYIYGSTKSNKDV